MLQAEQGMVRYGNWSFEKFKIIRHLQNLSVAFKNNNLFSCP